MTEARSTWNRKMSEAEFAAHTTRVKGATKVQLLGPLQRNRDHDKEAQKREGKSKYRNQRTIVDGITFASKAEAKRYGELKVLEMAGEIYYLRLQPRYRLEVKGVHVCTYIADFAYAKSGAVRETVEDVKGMKTALYSLKKKLVKACHGIEIVEIR